MKHLKLVIKGVFTSLVLITSMNVLAAWPDKPITLIVPFPPGGNTDLIARLIAPSLSTKLGQPVIVENKPGAGSMIGSQYVARSKDGHTFLMGTFANVLNEFFYRNKLVDLRKDLVPVTQVLTIANYFATAPNSKINSIADIISQSKANPGSLSCGSSGVGTSGHLACEMLVQRTGIKLNIIPYKGGAPAITDVIGGHTNFLAINEVLPHIRDGRMKGLAITSEKRSPLAPELAPVSDTVPGYDLVSWYGVFAPANTPTDVVSKLNTEIVAVIKERAVQDRIMSLGASPVGNSPKEFAEFINNDLVKWEKVIKPMNIYLD
ncbi:Bug family tripartite tricarboxylate transporter substrate binding protein [Polynucleobacter antarcticus]|nr:tripartite tricarboxylate transporter substrate binding protein [Polynucleobacter antarcticus]